MSTKKLSNLIEDIFSETREKTSLGALVDEIQHHGMAIILILFSIPSAIPVPAAGYSTLLSVPLLAIGICFLLGRDTLWLPKKVRAKEFDPKDFKKAKSLMTKISAFIERFSKPRLTWLTRSRVSSLFLGCLICSLAAFMAVPIPGTNTAPAGGIFLIGFGLLEDDGIFVGAGIIYSILAILLAITIVYFVMTYGTEGYEMVKDYIKNAL